MTGRGVDEPGPGREAALRARGHVEGVLFALPEIPLALDRVGVRDRLLRVIQYLYAVLDSAVTATVHLDGLSQGAVMVAEARELLAATGDATTLPSLDAAIGRLRAAEDILRRGAEAVSEIQFARRDELSVGKLGALPSARPFRASMGVPRLHSFARQPLLPHVVVEPKVPLLEAAQPATVISRPKSFGDLAALVADATSGALEARLRDAPVEPPVRPPPEPLPFPYVCAVGEAEVLRRVGHDCLEDIANSRNLRKPNATESWVDQGPFEQRLLDNLDAFAALGGSVLPLVSLFHAEAEAPDPERAFAVALALGCIEGSDTVGAAVMTLKQSPPEELPGWLDGFKLASSPAVDAAMAELCASPRPELVALALDVLHERGTTPDAAVVALLRRIEPEIARRMARALGTALPRNQAIEHLEKLCTQASDDDTFLAALESLLLRGHSPAFDILRRLVDAPHEGARNRRALPLLCFVGRANDHDRLLRAVAAAPTARLLRAIGRFGHVGSLAMLLDHLKHEDADVVVAAAEALMRITGAPLRETVEERWEVQLPPEAVDAAGIPIPTRKVERIVTDPERWSAWVEDNARRFDTKVKTRGGVPFSPLQIVDEIEATSTPPERREDAARELALVTGMTFPFSPHDWVARQKEHLGALRPRVAAVRSPRGAWPAPSRRPREDTEPTSRRPVSRTPVGPAQQGTTPPSPKLDAQLGRGAVPTEAAPVRGATTLPTPLASTSAARAPATTEPLSAFAPGPALPFVAGAMPAIEATLQPTVVAPAGGTDTMPIFGPPPPARAALGPLAPAAPAPADAAGPPPSRRRRRGNFTLDQYAALCAEIAVFPENVEEAFTRYGLANERKRLAMDTRWKNRLRQSSADRAAWERLYLGYHAFFLEQARGRGRH